MALLMVFLLLNIAVCTSVKRGHGGLVSLYVRLGDVCIDLVHGGSVGPAADLHGDTLRHLQVIGQGGEAVPLRYNYDKPEKPRRIKGFEVFSLVFSSFSKPKNHTEISRIVGGVSLTTNE